MMNDMNEKRISNNVPIEINIWKLVEEDVEEKKCGSSAAKKKKIWWKNNK